MYTKDEIKKQIIEAVNKVKAANPMAGSITNSVTINFVANAQLAVGGSAAMVYLPDEGEFIATAVYNLAGKRAELRTSAPSSFQTAFLDELYIATAEEIADNPFDMEKA